MKLDKIAFANVVKYIMELRPQNFFNPEDLDDLIDIPVPEPVKSYSLPSEVDALLATMNQPGKKIEAIKAYRSLTGAGLKESKDAVERYWTEPLAIQQFGEPEPQEDADGDNYYTAYGQD